MALVVLAIGAGAAACGKGDARDAENAIPAGVAEYTIVLKSTWTAANHPFEYPSAGALTGPHFSGLIGASHDASYKLFSEGVAPTPGLENLSEQGKHSPLDGELREAATRGSVGELFESGPLKDFGDSLVATVRVDEHHSLVSLVAMIAPSPDWFTGAANIDLLENGMWVSSRTLALNAYDSGGDDGTTYKAPDRDNSPKKATMLARTRHFVVNDQPVPVATLTIRKN
jgi:hypothetical protein